MFGGVEHPWLDPLWRRIALVLFCCFWTGVEFYNQNQTWGIIVALVSAYAFWSYLISYRPTHKDNSPSPDSSSDQD